MCKKRSKALSAALSIAILAGMLTTANAAPASFDDVPAGAWFYNAVTACAEKGIVSGMGGNKYMPDNNLTYAQFVTMLVNAFYKDEQTKHESANVTKIDAYYDGNTPWWGYYAYFFADKALFKDTYGNAASSAMMNSNIDRYEMAQIVANILADNDFTVSDGDKASAQGRIADWAKIPAKYQPAVASAFSLGVISGVEDGSFGGTGVLTRAQACVVMVKLDDVLTNGPGTGGGTTDPGPVDPEPKPGTEKDIIVSTTSGNSMGVGYYVGDNGFATGTLNNGKPITEANVLALLAKAQKEWPSGLSWAERTVSNNHWYQTSGSVVDGILRGTASTNYACGGFAAMISDYLFGKSNNPAHKVTNVADIRPGDIVIHFSNGKATHVSVAASSAIKDGIYAGRVWLADGNEDSQVNWPNYDESAPWSVTVEQYYDPTYTWEAWSRSPD